MSAEDPRCVHGYTDAEHRGAGDYLCPGDPNQTQAALRDDLLRTLCTDHGHARQQGGQNCRTCNRRVDALLPIITAALVAARTGEAARWQVAAAAADDALRDALRVHHPVMRSETGPLSGCRCGQVRLGEDVIAHVVGHLRAALDGAHADEAAQWQAVCQCGHPQEFHTRRGCQWSVVWSEHAIERVICACPAWTDAPEPRAAGRLRWLAEPR